MQTNESYVKGDICMYFFPFCLVDERLSVSTKKSGLVKRKPPIKRQRRPRPRNRGYFFSGFYLSLLHNGLCKTIIKFPHTSNFSRKPFHTPVGVFKRNVEQQRRE